MRSTFVTPTTTHFESARHAPRKANEACLARKTDARQYPTQRDSFERPRKTIAFLQVSGHVERVKSRVTNYLAGSVARTPRLLSFKCQAALGHFPRGS